MSIRWCLVPSGLVNVLHRRNHPETTVYNQCTNLCLQHAIDTQDKKKPKPLLSLDDKKPLPPMPKPGDVDFIYGGSCLWLSLCLKTSNKEVARSSMSEFLSYEPQQGECEEYEMYLA